MNFNTLDISYHGKIDLSEGYQYQSNPKPTPIQRQIELSVTNGRGYESFGQALAIAIFELGDQGIPVTYEKALEVLPINDRTSYMLSFPSEKLGLYKPGFIIHPPFEFHRRTSLAQEGHIERKTVPQKEQMTLVEMIKLNATKYYHFEKRLRATWKRVRENHPEIWARAFKVDA